MNYFVRALTSLSHTLNSAVDIQRFPPPEFEGGHALPQTTTPMPHSEFFEYLDVAVLVGALSLASYFVYTKRSRSSVFYLSIFSLIYFGFFRKAVSVPSAPSKTSRWRSLIKPTRFRWSRWRFSFCRCSSLSFLGASSVRAFVHSARYKILS